LPALRKKENIVIVSMRSRIRLIPEKDSTTAQSQGTSTPEALPNIDNAFVSPQMADLA
jgi:hypothetical protein